MPLINCEINLVLSADTAANGATKFALADTKLYDLLMNDNAELLQQLKSGYKRTIK